MGVLIQWNSGMEWWNGVEWNGGMEWNGMEWNGMTSCSSQLGAQNLIVWECGVAFS